MDSEKKIRKSIIVMCCCIVCVITAAVCVVVYLSAKKNNTENFSEEQIILQVGDLSVTEGQFRFFAKLILNQEEETVKALYDSAELSDKDEIKKYTADFAHEYLARVSEAKKKGVVLTEQERSDLEKQFEADYESNKKIDSGELDKTEFYLYYYGISEKEYKTFWENWYLIDKHTRLLEAEADISEETQLLAFEEYFDYLYSYTISVMEFKVEGDSTKEVLLTKAHDIASALEQGADFVSLLKENCTNEELLKTNGVQEFYPVYKNEATEIYDFVRTSELGEVDVIETEHSVYVIRLDDIKDFEKLKNTETLLKWTRTFYVNKTVADILDCDDYKLDIKTKAYDAVNLSEVLLEAYTYWETVWEESK